ncbi:MAG: DUF1778 domain-containing protein [Chloroflexota bacterium]
METEHATQPTKNQRIATRVTSEHKLLFEQAALLKGISLTDFMVSSAYDAAVKVLMDSQAVLEVGAKDSHALIERLLHPRQPSELPELQKAAAQNPCIKS